MEDRYASMLGEGGVVKIHGEEALDLLSSIAVSHRVEELVLDMPDAFLVEFPGPDHQNLIRLELASITGDSTSMYLYYGRAIEIASQLLDWAKRVHDEECDCARE